MSLHEATHPSAIFSDTHRDGDNEVHVNDDAEVDDETQYENQPIPFKFSCRKLWKFMGPGWLMSLAYLDPGNLTADLQQGATTGYTLLWVLFWASVIGLMLQELSSRMAVVTGGDLAQHVRKYYPRWMNYIIYGMMELAIIGADIQEVVGCAVAFHILFKWPIWFGCLFTGFDSILFMMVHRAGMRYLEAFITILIMVMIVSFTINFGETETDVTALFKGMLPLGLQKYEVQTAGGIMGAVIMPHNFYLHSGLALSRKINRKSPVRVKEAILYNCMESTAAIGFSFLVNLALVGSNANLFYSETCAPNQAACIPLDALPIAGVNCSVGDAPVTPMNCACSVGSMIGACTDQFGLASESRGLAHAMASSAPYIWAIGLLAAGEASTVTCTYAGQVLMGGCIHINLPAWQRVTMTRLFALVPSVIIAVTMCQGTCETQAFGRINDFLNTWQNIQLPWAMFPLLYFGSQTAILGRYRSGMTYLVITFVLCAFVIFINLYAIQQWLAQYGLSYLWFIPYGLIWGPMSYLMLFPPEKHVEEPLAQQD